MIGLSVLAAMALATVQPIPSVERGVYLVDLLESHYDEMRSPAASESERAAFKISFSSNEMKAGEELTGKQGYLFYLNLLRRERVLDYRAIPSNDRVSEIGGIKWISGSAFSVACAYGFAMQQQNWENITCRPQGFLARAGESKVIGKTNIRYSISDGKIAQVRILSTDENVMADADKAVKADQNG